MKKFLVMLLVLMLALSSVAVAFGEEYPSYLNLDSMLPVVKEGEESPTVKMAVLRRNSGTEWEDLWLAAYIAEYMGINLEVEMIDSEAVPTYKTTAFASGDVPDMLVNLSFTTTELVTYGQEYEMLLDMTPYINETLTPNIWKWYSENPEIGAYTTAPNGAKYTLPKILRLTEEGGYQHIKVNVKAVEELGAKVPATLDEFVDLLRLYKEKNPDCVPMAGAIDEQNPGYIILNALGFVTTDWSGYGLKPAVRNGDFALPVYNELFKEYLTVMNTMYKEGLISDNFFLAELTEVQSDINQAIVAKDAVYSNGVADWKAWQAMTPLTSEWNETPITTIPNVCSVGGFSISADTEYPELCMRFADTFFSFDYTARMMWIGPKEGSEEALGWRGNIATESGEGWVFPNEYLPEGFNDLFNYLISCVSIYADFGTNDHTVTLNDYSKNYMEGIEFDPQNYNYDDGNSFYRAYIWQNAAPYGSKYTFPRVVFYDEVTSQREADLISLLEPYVKQQVAMFISGDRALDEFDAFQAELKDMGIEELYEIYNEVWVNYKANLDA